MDRPWWQEAVVYQIYPRSFNDSNGDGIGDLPGIRERVPYLNDLGVDAVWLSPIYESPMADHGYDVANYRSIHPDYGTMDDFEALRDTLGDHDIRLILDMVVNHTSDEHDWFERSRNREDPYTDFYHWQDSDDGPPNNWESVFGGSAWSYDETRGEYYLHLFDEKQPDLNWRNPQVRDAVVETMNWWLDRGVDGYRLDVINLLSKTEGLPDGVDNTLQIGVEHFWDGPELDEYLAELYERVFAERDVVAIGEMPGIGSARGLEFTENGDPLSMLIAFDHVVLDWGPGGRWDPTSVNPGSFQRALMAWQDAIDDRAWTALYLENHDQPRAVSRFGDDSRYHYESATALATVITTLRGSPFIYQGQEIGMTNSSFPDPAVLEDVESRNYVAESLEEGASYEDIRPAIEAQSRDNARTPMQWDDSEQAGFTTGEPWLPVTPNYTDINVEAARANEDSIWHYYRSLIELRSERAALVTGSVEPVEPRPDAVFAYRRVSATDELLIATNLTDEAPVLELEDDGWQPLTGNYSDPPSTLSGRSLRPYEAVIAEREHR
ncbi:MAG: alpha-glucosidase [Natrialbaceae archaeon]|nr:alpha-glucosidase [Natrialbaceae archaeon]